MRSREGENGKGYCGLCERRQINGKRNLSNVEWGGVNSSQVGYQSKGFQQFDSRLSETVVREPHELIQLLKILR